MKTFSVPVSDGFWAIPALPPPKPSHLSLLLSKTCSAHLTPLHHRELSATLLIAQRRRAYILHSSRDDSDHFSTAIAPMLLQLAMCRHPTSSIISTTH